MVFLFLVTLTINVMQVLKNQFDSSENAEWFKDWFNSLYYHKLYSNRDYKEANLFLENLIAFIKLPQNSAIWDLACGKGRHSIKLNKMGFNVVGTDLSENSITEALKFANDKLDFFVHDMRTPNRINYFDAVFNLFTSIGYFDKKSDNEKVFLNVFNALRPNGIFVVDFFNAEKVKRCMVEKASIKVDDVTYLISKKICDNRIVKRIEFTDNNNAYYFDEKVSLFGLKDFEDFGKQTGFKLSQVFGDYNLSNFDEQSSDRLILIFNK